MTGILRTLSREDRDDEFKLSNSSAPLWVSSFPWSDSLTDVLAQSVPSPEWTELLAMAEEEGENSELEARDDDDPA